MGILLRLHDWTEKRLTSREKDFWKRFDDSFSLATAAGVSVTPEKALGHSPVSASVRLLAETAASLPLNLYRRTTANGTESKELARKHFLWPILTRRPNRYQTSYEFREMLMTDVLLSGNFVAQKVSAPSGRILALMPLPISCVTIEAQPDGEIIYRFTPITGQGEQTFRSDQIWHLKDMSRDVITGASRVTTCRESIGSSMAVEKFGAEFFSQGAVPGAVAKHKARLSDSARLNLKESISEFMRKKRHGVMLLEEGLEYEQMEISNEANQFLGTREFSVNDIGRIWRVPPFLIGHPDKSINPSTTEQQVSAFITFSLRSWLVRIEQSINANVIPENDQDEYFVEHEMSGLARGDMESRFKSYLVARQGEWMSANEIRARENMNPRPEGGDDFTNPNVKSPGVSGSRENANPEAEGR